MRSNAQVPAAFGPREHAIYFGALGAGKWVLRTADAAALGGVTAAHARKLLHELHRKGVLVRAAKGIYALVPPEALRERKAPQVDAFRVLDQLMGALELRYYAAYMTAVHLHGAAHQLPFHVDVATPRPRRPLRLGRVRVAFHRVPEDRFAGTARLRQSGEYLTASDTELTLIDCADRLDLCGGAEGLAQVAWELAPRVDAAKLRKHATWFDANPALARLGFVLERIRDADARRVQDGVLQGIRARAPRGRRYVLDPALPAKGPLDAAWRVRVNADVLGWRRA